ncbi:MAG: hypothetical protein IH619_03640 [Ignavibacterium sp.]|nr:hypothetical protein [Ignavibacterium sp.]
MKHLFFLLMLLVLSSCSVFEEDDITRPIPVDSVFVNNSSNLTAEFTAKIYCGSYCWKNTYFEKSILGNNVFIKTFAVSEGSSVCPAVCVEYQTLINIVLPASGSYTFHFWKSDSTSIDTTLILGI